MALKKDAMILPGTTYKTTKDLTVKGTIHFYKAYSEGFAFELPKGTDYMISYWAEPSDNAIQVWPLDPEIFKGQIVDKEILDSPFYDSYSFNINRVDVEHNSILTYDFSKAIYFYSANDEYGAFSNFSPYGIDFDGVYYPTLEHYFQSQKFIDASYAKKVRTANTPKEAFDLGKSRDYKIKDNWDEIKDDIMFAGLKKKFETHQHLKDLLISTGDLVLIENSPFDNYWGIGRSGNGFNKLGVILMRVRLIIKTTPNT